MLKILGQYGLNTDANLPKLGVNHADELYLMWEPIYDKEHPLNPEDQASYFLLDTPVPKTKFYIQTNAFSKRLFRKSLDFHSRGK